MGKGVQIITADGSRVWVLHRGYHIVERRALLLYTVSSFPILHRPKYEPSLCKSCSMLCRSGTSFPHGLSALFRTSFSSLEYVLVLLKTYLFLFRPSHVHPVHPVHL
jgi:hypothetical protein